MRRLTVLISWCWIVELKKLEQWTRWRDFHQICLWLIRPCTVNEREPINLPVQRCSIQNNGTSWWFGPKTVLESLDTKTRILQPDESPYAWTLRDGDTQLKAVYGSPSRCGLLFCAFLFWIEMPRTHEIFPKLLAHSTDPSSNVGVKCYICLKNRS